MKINQFSQSLGSVLMSTIAMTIGAIPSGSATPVPATSVRWTPSAPVQVAQTITRLTERSDFVGGCRLTSEALSVFDDARQTQPTGSLAAETRVTLTGVLGEGIAQIRSPRLGWIRVASLRTCEVANPNPVRGECRRLRDPITDGPAYEELRFGLRAYDNPGRGIQVDNQGNPDGPTRGARVFFTAPPQFSDGWVRVFYRSRSGFERVGWVSLGSNNRVNFAYCT